MIKVAPKIFHRDIICNRGSQDNRWAATTKFTLSSTGMKIEKSNFKSHCAHTHTYQFTSQKSLSPFNFSYINSMLVVRLVQLTIVFGVIVVVVVTFVKN